MQQIASIYTESYFIGFGKIKKAKSHLFIWSVGPAYINIIDHHESGNWFLGSTNDEVKKNRTVGIQAEVQLLGAWKVIGGGVTAFVNLNPKSPYAGITLTAALGKMHFLKTH